MRKFLIFAVLFALASTQAHAQRLPPFDVERLHPDVRAAALRAREAEARAEAAAAAAREAAQRGEEAAERARSGATGHRAYDFENDQQQRRYEGGWSEEERAAGFGVLTFGAGVYEGDRYAGSFRCGRKYGPGVYYHAPNQGDRAPNRYEGDYVFGEAERYGVFYGSSGFRHVGRSGRDAFNGPAVYYFPNGERYEGEFARNRPNGFGVLWSERGRVRRSGIWTDGRLTTRLRRDDPSVHVEPAAVADASAQGWARCASIARE
ncbi:MAG TPA: hypothetical protein VEA80_04970 [Vitreimonas sp.]|uniref:hypothetical protein n=1 Tax=Vitreimonas sp. TaxID=3069702 RepID=UPI002D2AB5C5|nr:hypothetical protein [Vitreimonas sp.]HYD86804.1 hypothetical protein [Vitreimonas sp.]